MSSIHEASREHRGSKCQGQVDAKISNEEEAGLLLFLGCSGCDFVDFMCV